MASILMDIRQMLGIITTDDIFDKELIIHINSAIMVLTQLGVGPQEGFKITGADETWEQLTLGRADIESVKNLVYFRTRLSFDPPQNGFLVDSMKKQCDEIEWRLEVAVSPEV